jgi:hypothetical protein
MAIKDLLTVFALVVSVSSVGVSLAREEVRCYLGLQSTECHPTNIKSDSLDKAIIKPISNDNSDTNANDNTTKTLPPTVENSPEKPVTEDNKTDSKTINYTSPVEEISRSQSIPVEPVSPDQESHQNDPLTDNSSSSVKEESAGIPIQVQPFQESSQSQP